MYNKTLLSEKKVSYSNGNNHSHWLLKGLFVLESAMTNVMNIGLSS